MDKNVLTLPQVTEQCSLGKEAILEHIADGRLIASKTADGQYIIDRKDLINFMNQCGIYPLSRYLPGSKKILVVDDESTVLLLLEKMLSKDGYLIESASNGLKASSKIMKFKPGLVVLDLFMPGIDGFELCRQIKNSQDTGHVKVLAISGKGDTETKRRILEAGADSYLAKPLDRNSLLKTVNKLLEKDLNTES